MIRRLLLAACFSLCAAHLQAQAFEPGLLVQSNGDTLRGLIENNFWTEPPTSIRFRAQADSPDQVFKPRQLRAVSFTQGRYFRYEVLPIDHAAETRLEKLTLGYSPDVRRDSVLADVLLEGPVMLLRVVTTSTPHYLIHLPGQPILDLSERKYLRNTTGNRVITDGNNYQTQLNLLFGNCPAAVEQASKIPFTPEGLAAVIQTYTTKCTPNQQPTRSWLAESRPRRRTAFQGGLLAGVRYNRIESVYTPLYNPTTDGACVDCRPRPFGGLYAELFQPGRRTAVYGELSLSSFRSKGQRYFAADQGGIVYAPFTYQALLGTARLGVRVFLPLPHDQQWFVGLGYELNKVIKPKVVDNANPLFTPNPQDLGYASTTLLPNISTGWRHKRLTVSLDGQLYVTGNVEDDKGALFGSNFALRLGLGYRLGRNPDVEAQPK
ncbi:hypothetical protein [Hymenobacter metallicola]|uniref:Outer membrane protein beta-barrel domain-containing protein n=1 Tax=Hymenobacter metallicola TaxID=2563114 RepID=A0A4Z0QDY8_9BACT|nr:hypothetical protein [Hymenobacter metallicola]TGE28328.1 hypothetical protein E5K02_02360 [Hymenobacter metallicola]